MPLCDLHTNIGRLATEVGARFIAQLSLMRFVAVQRIWDGSLTYRVQDGEGDFGRPARPEELAWVDEGAPCVKVTLRCDDVDVFDCGDGVRLDQPQALRVLEAAMPRLRELACRLEWAVREVRPL